MVIVQINYTHPDMPKAEWEARYTDDRAKQFLAVPGLQWKIWLDGPEDRRAGGRFVGAYTLEYPHAVMQCVSEHMGGRFAPRLQLAVVPERVQVGE